MHTAAPYTYKSVYINVYSEHHNTVIHYFVVKLPCSDIHHKMYSDVSYVFKLSSYI